MSAAAAFLSLMASFPAIQAGQPTEIIAHRGASHDAPENTVASINLAWQQNADASEFDVFLSKDGRIVVIHDKDTKRVAGVDRKVADQSLHELRQLDVGSWKDKKFAGERIPTLEEMLVTVPPGKRVFIEVKSGPEIIPELDRVLRASRLKPEQTAVISFHADVVAAAKKARSDLEAYWIVSLKPAKGKKLPTAEELIAKAAAIRADGLDLSASEVLDEVFASKVKKARLKLYVWTVNDLALARRMIEIGVDGITTDRPGWLREGLASKSLPTDDGYRGIWYMNLPLKNVYKFKYSGGLATYPQQHMPIAIYSKAANKTFFCYGGRPKDKNELLHMISYYDHSTGMVPRPRILLHRKTNDAHDNPTMQIDEQGHLWIFSNSHGAARPSFVHKSVKPHSIDGFELIWQTNFSYGQPWHLPGKGFLFLHTRYKQGRGLFSLTSVDGLRWDEPQPLANIGLGDYQISWRHGDRIATAFDCHPKPQGINARTNIYYLESINQGKTWTTVNGKHVTLPLSEMKNAALVHDFAAEKKLVFLKDLQFDAQGRAVILYITSTGPNPGPEHGPREWFTSRWTGLDWERRRFTESDHNYDHGSLYIEADGTWRIIAPTDPGPQPHATGGEMVLWTSSDQGETWKKVKQLTKNGLVNHTYARRPLNAHPDFYALWADGDALQQSDSSLYFTDRDGKHVWRLPAQMTEEFMRPKAAW